MIQHCADEGDFCTSGDYRKLVSYYSKIKKKERKDRGNVLNMDLQYAKVEKIHFILIMDYIKK